MPRKRLTWWSFCRGRLATGRAAVPGKSVRFGAEFRVRETAASARTYASTNSKGRTRGVGQGPLKLVGHQLGYFSAREGRCQSRGSGSWWCDGDVTSTSPKIVALRGLPLVTVWTTGPLSLA